MSISRFSELPSSEDGRVDEDALHVDGDSEAYR
jgi:hypothetical protein